MPRELRQRVEGTLYRNIDLRKHGVIDVENRTVHISISSETAVLRQTFFSEPWLETLGHKRGEVNLDRLKNGATLHYNHSRDRADRLGVVESATIVDKRIEVDVRFSKNKRVNDVWDDVRDGILRNVSVGYRINERKLMREGATGGPDEFRITSWTPMEVSFVDIPADPTVGVGRDDAGNLAYRIVNLETEGNIMKFDTNGNPVPETDADRAAIAAGTATREDGSPYKAPVAAAPQPAQPVRASVIELDTARDEGKAEGRREENTRRQDITALFTPFGDDHNDVRDDAIKDNRSVAETRSLLLTAIGAESTPAAGEATRIEAGEVGLDNFKRDAILSIAVRSGFASDEERATELKTGLRGYTLFELARRSLELSGVDTGRMDKMALVGRAFTTSDFPLILADAANKSMLKGFSEAPETWQTWAQTGNLSDFKLGRRVNLSSFNDLELVNEDGEYKYGSFSEQGETIQLATYGKLFAISRQSIINDDLGAFTRIPGAMGRAASRVVGDLAYGALTSNPLMGDGQVLFIGSTTLHKNLNLSGAGGTPLTANAAGIAAIAAMRNGMALQSDASGSATGLNIRPSFMLVPVVLEDVARSLMTDTTEPGQANPGVRNTVRGLAEVISDPRLDADSATRYYLAAGQQFDTIEVAFLDGNQSPVLEQQAGWSIDGTEYKVRIDVAAAPMEFRTWQRDDGA